MLELSTQRSTSITFSTGGISTAFVVQDCKKEITTFLLELICHCRNAQETRHVIFHQIIPPPLSAETGSLSSMNVPLKQKFAQLKSMQPPAYC